MSNPVKRILVLMANPENAEWLRLDEELRLLKEGLRRANRRDQFEIVSAEAVTIDALRRAMLDYEPQIVHFSGHGTGERGLVLLNELGEAKLIPSEALADLFDLFKDTVECVVLNACYSEVQAKAIVQTIDHVIGMSDAIGDTAARKFAVGFYDGLGAGRSLEFSYKLGCNAIAMEGIPEHLTPVLLKKSDATPPVSQPPVSQPKAMPTPPPVSSSSEAVEIFFSYSHKDEDLRDKLANHLSMMKRQGVIKAWHDREISAGTEWEGQIDQAMNTARVILLLISDDFLASDYCYDMELKRAMERHEAREARVIPIILRPVDWRGAPFGKLQALPKNAKAVTTWDNRDEAFVNIAQGIRQAVESLQSTPSVAPALTAQVVGTRRELVVEPTAESFPPPNAVEPAPLPSLPEVELDNPTGQVPINSPFYVDRPPIESECYRTISNPGALILIKAPRQMGKTSLMSRILHYGQTKHNYYKAHLSLLEADNEVFASSEIFLKWFCSSITYELGLDDRVEEQWKSVVGNRQKCTNYFQKYLLSQVDSPLVLGLDEVDRLFDHFEIAEAFFSLLRAWHERSKNEPVWQKLRLVLAHSQEVYISLNVNQSPFNVGQTVRLSEFNRTQVEDLIQRHGLHLSTTDVDQLIGILDGHPYLLRIALYQIASGRLSLERLLELAPTQEGPFGEHLRHHLSNLNADPKLRAAMKRLVTSDRPVELEQEQLFKLCSMGLAELRGNAVIPLCNLYRIYFRHRLRDE